MTLRDLSSGMSAAYSQRSQLLAALIEAGTDGVPLDRVKELGGGWWYERLRELQKAGHAIGEDHAGGETRIVLAGSVERTSDSGAVKAPGRDVAGSLNPPGELTLFPARSTSRSPYDTREAA